MVPKARHLPGNVLRGGVRKGPVGRRRRFLLLGDRTYERDPSTLTLGNRQSFAGTSTNERLRSHRIARTALRAFRAPVRRQRVLEAFEGGEPTRSVRPGNWGRPKAGSRTWQERESFTWRLRPMLHLRRSNSEKMLRHRSGRRARSCSTSPLPGRKLDQESGVKASRGAPQKMPQRAWRVAPSVRARTRTAGTPARGKALRKQPPSRPVRQLGNVPVRQCSVAEFDDDDVAPLTLEDRETGTRTRERSVTPMTSTKSEA